MTATGSPALLRGPAARAAQAARGPWLLVMPLQAAEEHVLVIVGEADVSTADQLLAPIAAVHPRALRVELGALEFCDLHGLDALHDAARAAATTGVHLTLTGMSAQLAWLHRAFPPFRADAIDPVGPRPSARQPAPRPTEADYRAGSGEGRRAAPDGLLHAVPTHDTTGSSACGARVRRPLPGWDATEPENCPDCTVFLPT